MTARKPVGNQLVWNQFGTRGMTKTGLSRARQIAGSRSYVYDGHLAPTCLRCGLPRDRTFGLKCDDCIRRAA